VLRSSNMTTVRTLEVVLKGNGNRHSLVWLPSSCDDSVDHEFVLVRTGDRKSWCLSAEFINLSVVLTTKPRCQNHGKGSLGAPIGPIAQIWLTETSNISLEGYCDVSNSWLYCRC
jgi:hypothetical protein